MWRVEPASGRVSIWPSRFTQKACKLPKVLKEKTKLRGANQQKGIYKIWGRRRGMFLRFSFPLRTFCLPEMPPPQSRPKERRSRKHHETKDFFCTNFDGRKFLSHATNAQSNPHWERFQHRHPFLHKSAMVEVRRKNARCERWRMTR